MIQGLALHIPDSFVLPLGIKPMLFSLCGAASLHKIYNLHTRKSAYMCLLHEGGGESIFTMFAYVGQCMYMWAYVGLCNSMWAYVGLCGPL